MNVSDRILLALRLGEFTVPQLEKMLCLHNWTIYRVLRSLERQRKVRMTAHRGVTSIYGRRWAA